MFRTGLQDLPNELLKKIYDNAILDYKDLVRLSSTCKSFKCLIFDSTSTTWKNYFNREFYFSNKYSLDPIFGNGKPISTNDWFSLFKIFTIRRVKIRNIISKLVIRYYNKPYLEKADFEAIDALWQNEPNGECFILGELHNALQTEKNLSLHYYYSQTLIHVKRVILKRIFGRLHPQENVPHELFSLVLSQWCRPEKVFFPGEVLEYLEEASKRVKTLVGLKYPTHPITRTTTVNCPVFFDEKGQQILECLNEVMFIQDDFKGIPEHFCNFDNLIDVVIETKKGIPLILSIIYAAIARRLGVLCEPIDLDRHVLLLWRPNHSSSPNDLVYIDTFKKGRLVSAFEARHYLSGASIDGLTRPSSPHLLLRRQINDFRSLRRGTEDSYRFFIQIFRLLRILNPNSYVHEIYLARVYIEKDWELDAAVELLENSGTDERFTILFKQQLIDKAKVAIERNLSESSIPVPKRRSEHPNIKFWVGQVVRLTKTDESSVVVGWDFACNESSRWIEKWRVEEYKSKPDQPFYTMMFNNGQLYYGPQDEMVEIFPTEFDHPRIWKYFDLFLPGQKYRLNDGSRMAYPDDEHFGSYGVD